jgi:Plavaka transposase
LKDDWTPYQDRVAFEVAEHLYAKEQMSATGIDSLMELWHASFIQQGIADGTVPFHNHKELYNTIDSTPLGGIPWQTFSLSFDGPLPDNNAPPWMHDKFEVWFRDPHLIAKSMLSNRDFANEFDLVPFREFDADGKQRWQNLMSGSWAWTQVVCIITFIFIY